MSMKAEPADLLPPGTPIDLDNCDREPIHTPGGIQPHGALVALDAAGARVVQHSQNAPALLGTESLLGTTADELFGREDAAALIERSQATEPRPLRTAGAGTAVDAFAYRPAPSVIVIELEPAGAVTSAEAVQEDLTRFLAALQDAASTDALLTAAAAIVRELTGFDRVWVYRFEHDDHGVVIAEERRPELPAYLGLHFPARDIPPQARALFLQNRVRFIPDSHAAPSPLEPLENPVTGDWLDLSAGVLRAVSPMHLQYLRNMGAHASMSIALAVRGRLWGLISGHHYTAARVVPHQARVACELIGRVCSMQLETLGALETSRRAATLDGHREAVLGGLAAGEGILSGLRGVCAELLAMCGADGAAVRIGDELALLGETPPGPAVRALLDAIPADQELRVTDRLEDSARPSCGMIAAALGRSGEDYLAWFRGEWRHELTWGDNGLAPSGAPAGGELTPSGSFTTWAESVTGHSRPWSAEEQEAVARLRSGLGTVLLEQAKELARINAELSRSNGDLEAFSFIVAHDLREPLRGIQNFVSFFLEDHGAGLDGDGREQLDTVLRLGGRMDRLMDALLDYARAGTLHPAPVRLTLQQAVDEVLELLPPDRGRPAIEVRGGDVPLRDDRERIQHVLLNLITNAMKYTADSGAGPITVAARPLSDVAGVPEALTRRPGLLAITVQDRGIGIAPEHREVIFTLFRRLHARDAYGGGSGAGLAIARRIAERHDGALWLAASAPGTGSTFAFSVQAADD